MGARSIAMLALVAACSGVIGLGSIGAAQRRRPPRAVPIDAAVQWTVFVSAYEQHPPQRSTASAEPGTIAVPLEGWQCTYSAPNRARLNETNWSEVRTLECTHADAIVSTTGFCQIAGPSWGARAGVLSLGTRASPRRVQVSIDCAVLN